MNKPINYWMISTIVLAVVFAFILFFSFRNTEKVYDIDGFKIPESSFKSLASVNTEDKFKICSIPENRCIILNKIEQYQGPVPEGCDEEYFRQTGITRCK